MAEHGENLTVIIVFLAAAIVLGGVLQIVVGFLRGGRLIKYMPYPVVASFMNGIAALIFVIQIEPFFRVAESWEHFELTKAIATSTIIAMLLCRRFFPRLPAALVALVVGVVVYLLTALLGLVPFTVIDNPLVAGPMPNPFADPDQLQQIVPLFHPEAFGEIESSDLRLAFEGAITLAILGTINSLPTSLSLTS